MATVLVSPNDFPHAAASLRAEGNACSTDLLLVCLEGCIGLEDLDAALRSMGHSPTKQDLIAMIASADTCDSAEIDFPEVPIYDRESL